MIHKNRVYLLDSIYTLIEENPSITPDILADKLFISVSHLRKLVKQYYNITLNECITKQRLHLAKQMLQNSSNSLSSVARRCGFGSKISFYRAFTKHEQITPMVYRQNTPI